MAETHSEDPEVRSLVQEAEARHERQQDVLERLQTAPGKTATAMLEAFVEGQYGHNHLGYEDWVAPLRATGGDVCLRAELPHAVAHWSIRPGDLLEAHLDGRFTESIVEPVEAAGMLRAAMQMDVLEPVPREATPFGGR